MEPKKTQPEIMCEILERMIEEIEQCIQTCDRKETLCMRCAYYRSTKRKEKIMRSLFFTMLLVSSSLNSMQLTTTPRNSVIIAVHEQLNARGAPELSHIAVRATDISDDDLCRTALDCCFDHPDEVFRRMVAPFLIRRITAAQVDLAGDRQAVSELIELYVARTAIPSIQGAIDYADMQLPSHRLHLLVGDAVRETLQRKSIEANHNRFEVERIRRNTKILVTCIIISGTIFAAIITAAVTIIVKFAG